jgi:hypothetical protein
MDVFMAPSLLIAKSVVPGSGSLPDMLDNPHYGAQVPHKDGRAGNVIACLP